MPNLDTLPDIHQAHYINGQWLAAGNKEFTSENPATSEILWQGSGAGNPEIEAAVSAAKNAFPEWASQSMEQRNGYIGKFVDILKQRSELLGNIIHLETGKPLWESKTEIATMIAKATVSHKAYEQRTGYSEAEANGVHVSLSHRPIGAFAVLGPYNFPGHLPNGHIIPAFLAGNTVIFKPSELTPLFSELMVQCWHDAGLPPGVLNLVQGDGMTGKLLSEHDGLDGLLFTGSSRTGQAIHKAFGGKTEKMLALEMGGNNPLVVESASDLNAAIYAIIQSAFISAGQRCTCARRLILIESESNRQLLDALVHATRKIEVGAKDGSFIGPVVSNRAADLAEQYQQDLIEKGGKALEPLKRTEQGKPFLRPGIVDVSDAVDVIDEECFAPLLQVKFVNDLGIAITEANNTRYGLSAGLLSENPDSWQHFRQLIRAGIVNWNRPITGASGAAPFGGVGASGNFRPGAFYSADYSAYPMASMASNNIDLPENLSPGISL